MQRVATETLETQERHRDTVGLHEAQRREAGLMEVQWNAAGLPKDQEGANGIREVQGGDARPKIPGAEARVKVQSNTNYDTPLMVDIERNDRMINGEQRIFQEVDFGPLRDKSLGSHQK